MRPFSGGNNNNNSNNNNQTKHQISCSSPSSHHSKNPNLPPPSPSGARKSMEELWKEINLPCLQDHPSSKATNPTNRSAFPGMILQDFFGRPFNKYPTTNQPSSVTTGAADDNNSSDFLNSLGPSPATRLTLNSSSSDFQFLKKSNPNPQLHTHVNFGTIPCFDSLGSSSIFPSLCKKRPQENQENSTERKHKRMIKNRESAARSRARKQAYTQELELEIDHLVEENARLRSEQEKLMAVPANLSKKYTLHRTSTAPF